MSNRSEPRSVRERIEDGMREVGTLLLAFAPLDVGLNGASRDLTVPLLIFLAAGALLFVGAVALERRRVRVR